jgi:hypothetical protein
MTPPTDIAAYIDWILRGGRFDSGHREPQQALEPVAWMYDWDAEGESVKDWLSKDYDEAHSPSMGCHNIRPLYTRPQPAREWVGLTDDEIERGLKESWVTEQAFKSAVWWAEKALKEKNT